MHAPPHRSIIREKSPDSPRYPQNPRYSDKSNNIRDIAKYLEQPIAKYADKKYLERQKSLEQMKYYDQSEQEVFNDRKYNNKEEHRRVEKEKKYFDDDGFEEERRYIYNFIHKFLQFL